MRHHFTILAVVLALSGPGSGCKKSETSSGEGKGQAWARSESSARPPSGPLRMQVKWPVGNRYAYRLEMDQTSEVIGLPVAQGPTKSDTTFNEEYAISVLTERPGGGRELELEFLTVQLDVYAADKRLMSYDSQGESAADDKNPVAAMFRKLVGTKVKYVLDASNKLERLEGVDELQKTLGSAMPAQMRGMFDGMFGEGMFRQMVDFDGRTLPARPVDVGDTWPVKIDLEMGPIGQLALEMDFTFKGWEERQQRHCAWFDFTGSMTTKGEGGSMMGMSFVLKDGKTTGKTWFDPDLGMTIDTDMRQDMKLLMTLPKVGIPPNMAGKSITNLMSQKLAIRLIRDESKTK